MKKTILLFTALLFLAISSTFAQEKYAVLIVSDYEDPNANQWNRGPVEPGPEIIEDTDEFWNDTYLMWWMLRKKGFKPENIVDTTFA